MYSTPYLAITKKTDDLRENPHHGAHKKVNLFHNGQGFSKLSSKLLKTLVMMGSSRLIWDVVLTPGRHIIMEVFETERKYLITASLLSVESPNHLASHSGAFVWMLVLMRNRSAGGSHLLPTGHTSRTPSWASAACRPPSQSSHGAKDAMEALERYYRKYDADNSGYLSKAEVDNFFRERLPKVSTKFMEARGRAPSPSSLGAGGTGVGVGWWTVLPVCSSRCDNGPKKHK